MAKNNESPRMSVDQELVEIWSEILTCQSIGTHDNFFDLGGDSILAAQVVNRVKDKWEVEISLFDFFEAPTIEGLSKMIFQGAQTQPLSDRIRPVEVSKKKEIPLSYAQQQMWVFYQLDPSSPVYNIPQVLHLSGPLDIPALEESLTLIIGQHEILRTVYTETDGGPVQTINPPYSIRLPQVDVSQLPESDQNSAVQTKVADIAQEPFNLSEGPIVRFLLLHLDPERHVLIVAVHHIAFDGWSTDIFQSELASHYENFLSGRSDSSLGPDIQYSDFVYWQKKVPGKQELNRQLAYWKKQLAGIPSFLNLPVDYHRPSVQSHKGARARLVVPDELKRALEELSKKLGVTLFTLMLTVFQILLYRYTGQEDIVVGAPVNGRTRVETETLIGAFINTVALRTNFQGNPACSELFRLVQQTILDAFNHQDLPFHKLVEAFRPERDLSRTPIYQVLFQLRTFSSAPVIGGGLHIQEEEYDRKISQFDLSVDVFHFPTQLTCQFGYCTDLFQQTTIERMCGHYLTLLESVAAAPQLPVGELSMLTKDEIFAQEQWNQTTEVCDNHLCVHQLFEQQVKLYPNAVAIQSAGGSITYEELNRRANQVGHYLGKAGVGPDVLVGIYAERSIDMIVGMLGVLKAGGAYVPLDPDYPSDRIATMLNDASVSLLLTQQHLIKTLPKNETSLICLDSDWEKIAQEKDENSDSGVHADNLMYVIYTSGSTGKPKGVMVNHRGVSNYLLWRQKMFPASATDRILQKTSFSFDISVWEIFWPLSVGAELVLAPHGERDLYELSRLIRKHGVTICQIMPSMLQLFLSEGEADACKSLQAISSGGEPLTSRVIESFFDCLDAQLLHGYGPTEASICVAIGAVKPGQKIISIGSTVDNNQLYLLDSNLNPVPIGVPGELCIGGVGLARGYLNRPALTEEKFVHHPFSDEAGARLYRTGDLAYRVSDGNIVFMGRIDNQVKIRGYRIEPGEIEAVLLKHSHLSEAAVIAVEETNGDKRLVAYVVPEGKNQPAVATLHQFMKEKVPDYMVPEAFVYMEAIPLTPNGKRDSQALTSIAPKVRPDIPFTPPRNAMEKKIAEIWADVLELEAVGVHDNFFESGGHSLKGTRVISRIRKAMSIELSLRILFDCPTVAELTQHIETRTCSTDKKVDVNNSEENEYEEWAF